MIKPEDVGRLLRRFPKITEDEAGGLYLMMSMSED